MIETGLRLLLAAAVGALIGLNRTFTGRMRDCGRMPSWRSAQR
jgi:uncharacterized membrane protein YhiD involved in acid resistance